MKCAAPRTAGGMADSEQLVFLVGHAICQQTGGSSLAFDLVERLARVAECVNPRWHPAVHGDLQ